MTAAPVAVTLPLPYRRPPLTANQRLHHMAVYRLRQEVKQAVVLLARSQRVPTMTAVMAELVWFKGDNRRADSDNIAPTLKPCLDGLKEAGVLVDDHAGHVLRTSQRIVYRRDDPIPSAGGRVHLVVTPLEGGWV